MKCIMEIYGLNLGKMGIYEWGTRCHNFENKFRPKNKCCTSHFYDPWCVHRTASDPILSEKTSKALYFARQEGSPRGGLNRT
jgi:hypothetical protein